ncbi:PIG-L family deacetylase [Chromohalobacter sp.]|uniref:PIG-L deacetylase family protein n=1 Tax=Chromohalobacter sp. TaxID=50740 RepID=UPI00258319FF|nr:PIG-L family deacetylase [Chromohalobacter sp.]MCI0592320.1 PIG-L family deacetylase [Chromohalobacter sp.]
MSTTVPFALFVSPHLDDIALSCGGLVERLASSGTPVLIATVCTGDRSLGQPLSAVAQHEHAQWRLGDRPYQHRCEEDAQACAILGAQFVHLGLLDAIYRRDENGAPLYTDNFIGGEVHPTDWRNQLPRVRASLANLVANAAHIYCPFAIGGHVDHVIVRGAVEALASKSHFQYYEDYPYAARRTSEVPAWTPEIGSGQPATRWSLQLVELTPEEIDARIQAIACYASQTPVLFKSAEAMPDQVRSYVAQVGGERYWQPA